jgi:hypothetical protein
MPQPSEQSMNTAKSLGDFVKKPDLGPMGGNGGSPVDLLGQIYDMMLKVQEEQDIDHELSMKEQKDKDKKEKDRNAALIKVLTARRKPKAKKPPKKKEEPKKEEPKKPEGKDKKDEAAKDKADKEAKAAKDKADKEAKAAKDKADKEAKSAKDKADKEAKQTAEKQKADQEQKKKTATEGKRTEPPPKAEPVPKPTGVKPPPSVERAGKITEKIGIGAAATTAALFGKEALAENISKYESGKAGYNAYNKGTVGNKMIPSDKPIDFSKMTISEFLRRGKLKSGDPDRLFAIGRYQIIPTTMESLVKKLKLDPETTVLDQPTQDSLFANGLLKAVRKKVDDYLTGKSDDKNGAILQLAQEFASIGIPTDMKVGEKQLKKGDSYYSGQGGNKAHNSPEEVGAALDVDRQKNLGNKSKTSEIPSQNVGSQINQASKENAELNANLEKQQQSTTTNTIDASSTQSSTTTQSQPKVDDRSAMQRKMQGQ